MRATFFEAWNNTRNLQICPTNGQYKLSCTYRGKEIYTYTERWNGAVQTYKNYRSGVYGNSYPTTRTERKEYTEAYIYLCEQIINDNK